MASNQNNTRFFSTLRHLARELDDGITKLQQRVQLEPQSATDSQTQHFTALKLSLDWKKELEALTKSGREVLTEMRDRNKVFDRSLQLVMEIMESNQTHIAEIQTYLQQYGYCLPAEETNSSAEEDSSLTKMELKQDHHLNLSKEDPPQPAKMSPRLEDFGISSYTLSMLSQAKVASLEQGGKVHTNCLQSTKSQMEGGCMRLDSVPTPFQTKGLMVTPSLFPNRHNSICKVDECLTCSPACSVFMKTDQTPLWSQVQEAKCSPNKQELAKALEFSDSPVPPVLLTPGIKQIPSLKELISESKFQIVPEECLSPEPPVLMTPGIQQILSMKEFAQQQTLTVSCHRSKVARQLKMDTGPVDSPVPPILQTPGIRQITDGNNIVDTTGKQNVMHLTRSSHIVCQEDLEMPKSPQLTYSLKDLEEMTESFRNTDLTDTFSHKYVIRNDGKTETQLTGDNSYPQIRKVHNEGAFARPGNTTLPSRPHLPSCNSSYLSDNTDAPSRHGNLNLPRMPYLQSFNSSYLSECPPEPLFASSVIDQGGLPPVPEFRSFHVNGSYLEPLLSTHGEKYVYKPANSDRHLQEDETAMMEEGLDTTGLDTQKYNQKKRGPRSEADRSRFGFRPEGGKTVLIQREPQSFAPPSKETRGLVTAGCVKLKGGGGISITAGLPCHSTLKCVDINKENNPYSYSHKTLFDTQR